MLVASLVLPPRCVGSPSGCVPLSDSSYDGEQERVATKKTTASVRTPKKKSAKKPKSSGTKRVAAKDKSSSSQVRVAKKESAGDKKRKALAKKRAANKAAHAKMQAAKEKKRLAAKKKAGKTTRKKSSKKRVSRSGKPTKAERRAAHPQRRTPNTGGREAKSDILEFFGSEDVSTLTEKELRELKLVFLRSYANRGIVRDGCVAAGTSWGTYTRWRDKDEGFNEGCKHAEMLAADRLEAEAHRRAHDGYDKPVIYQGEITETYREYSDSLMQTLMKGYKKDKYRDRTEHSGSVGRPMTLDAETKESVVSSILGMIESKPDPKD